MQDTTATSTTTPQAYGGNQPMIAVALYRSEPEVNWSIAFLDVHDQALDYEFWSSSVVCQSDHLEYDRCKWIDRSGMRINDDYDFDAEDSDEPQILTGSRTHKREDGSLTDFWDLLVFTGKDREFWEFLQAGEIRGEGLDWGTDRWSMLEEVLTWARYKPSAAQLWLDGCDLGRAGGDPLKQIQRAIRQGLVE